jgi:mannitol-specific phosphotransferase system IIBC component
MPGAATLNRGLAYVSLAGAALSVIILVPANVSAVPAVLGVCFVLAAQFVAASVVLRRHEKVDESTRKHRDADHPIAAVGGRRR